jgi:uncharacterized membrane protein YbhN (UPF0104 family)
MSFDTLSIPSYVIAGVWAMVVNALPLTPGGLGLAEATFAQIAVLLATAPSQASYANVFLAMRILIVLISTLGLLPYLAVRGQTLEAVPSDPEEAVVSQPRQAP